MEALINKTDYVKAWILTTRPKTLILSVFPFFVGTCVALNKVGQLDFSIMAFAILSALFIQIGTNFINDVYDFKNKADKVTRLGPKRGIQSGILTSSQVFLAALFCFALALISGIPLVLMGGAPICFILILSVIFGFIYTGGPKPLAYNGLGELFVIIFFGLVSTMCAYFFQTGYIDNSIALVGLQLGLLASMPIAINNLRDIEDDAKVDKKTLAVRCGKTFARIEISLLVLVPFTLLFFQDSILPALALPLALSLCKNIWETEPSSIYNQFLGKSIMLYMIFNLLLIAGFFGL